MPDFSRVTRIFTAALSRDPADRAALLDAECGDDEGVRAEVESLLAAHAAAGGFLETAAAVAAGLVEAEAAPLAERSRLGPYLVERELGRGGMGIVYLAEDTRLGRKVALKVLAPEFARDAHRRERMRLEARAAAALAHPGIATVYALEEIDGRLCLVCEYVPGATLREEIARGPASAAQLCGTGAQVAGALAAAHAAGVVHRDLKPENVMRDLAGRIRILDFGVARFTPALPPAFRRLTQVGSLLGTPAYMSPEQLDGAEVDSRSDIFALGVLLFELASGQHPFETATPASTAARVLAAEPPNLLDINPGLPSGLERVVRRCLQKDPAHRYQSATEVAADLESLRAVGAPGAMGSPGVARSARRGGLTPRGWWVLHQGCVMVVAALMVWGVGVVNDLVKSDWTLALLLGSIAAAAVNGTLRAHLLFMNTFNEADLPAQLEGTEPWLRRTDWMLGALLLGAVLPIARSHTVLGAALAAVSLGWLVASLAIEPSTRRTAFPGRP